MLRRVLFGLYILGVAASASTTPMPCETPKQWEGNAWFHDQECNTVMTVDISYDEENNRTRSFTRPLQESKANETFEAILLHEKDLFFFIYEHLGVCVVTHAFFEFQPARVPANATFQYPEKRGLGNNAVATNTFAKVVKGDQFLLRYHDRQSYHHHPYCKGHDHDSSHNHTWYASFTNDTCVPVLETLYEGDLLGGETESIETLFSIRYSNITAGISSDNVFEPPPVCGTNVTKVETSQVPGWYRFMYFYH